MKTRLTSIALPRIVFWLLAVFLAAKHVTVSATPVVTVMAVGGEGQILYIKSDGSLWGMSYNADGELGDGTAMDPGLPERIIPPQQFVGTNLVVSTGTNLLLKGLNEFSAGSAIVLSSTNIPAPLNERIPIWTNGVGGGNFNFTVTNAVNATILRRFFRLELLRII